MLHQDDTAATGLGIPYSCPSKEVHYMPKDPFSVTLFIIVVTAVVWMFLYVMNGYWFA